MGQLYDLLGWGVLDPPSLDEATHWEAVQAVLALGLETAYETEPLYVVIPLAVDEPFLQEVWHLPGLPEWVPRVAPRTARGITAPSDAELAAVVAASQKDLATLWQEAQRLYATAGLTLGAPTLILLSDWD